MVTPVQVLRWAIIAIVVVLLSSCVITNPYIQLDAADTPKVSDDGVIQFADAVAYARTIRGLYRAKLAKHAKLANNTGSGLITLAGLILGLAAFDVYSDAILISALVGGTGYTLSSRSSSNPREIVYLAGMEATACAVEAMLPLSFSSKATTMLYKNVDTLSTSIETVGGDIRTVRSLIATVGDNAGDRQTADLQQARAEVTRAEKLIETADAAYVAGSGLLRSIDRAGMTLVAAVDAITVEVDKAVQQTQPRIESLADIIGQLSSATDIFAPGLGISSDLSSLVGKRVEPESEDIEKYNSMEPIARLHMAVNALATSALLLASATRTVSGTVKGVNQKKPVSTLKKCGVTISDIETDIRVLPTEIQVLQEAEVEHSILVEGGKKNYVARFLTSPTPGVEVITPRSGDSVIRVKFTKDSTPSTYTLLVEDSAEHRKTVTVTVMGKSVTNGQNGDVKEVYKKFADFISNKSVTISRKKFEVTAELSSSGVTVNMTPVDDQIACEDAREAILSIEEAGNRADSFGITEEKLDVKGVAPCMPARPESESISSTDVTPKENKYGDVVASLSEVEITRIQIALCLTGDKKEKLDGKWGPVTQRKYRENGRSKDNTDNLTRAERVTLLGLTRTQVANRCKKPSDS